LVAPCEQKQPPDRDGRWLRDVDLPVLRLPSALGRRRLPPASNAAGRGRTTSPEGPSPDRRRQAATVKAAPNVTVVTAGHNSPTSTGDLVSQMLNFATVLSQLPS